MKNKRQSSLVKGANILPVFLKRAFFSSAAVLVMGMSGFAEEGVADSTVTNVRVDSPAPKEPITPEKKVDISGYGAIEGGQIMKGHYQWLSSEPEITHVWLGHVYAGLSVNAKVHEYFSVLVSLESRLWYTTPLNMQADLSTFGAPLQNFDITFPYAEGIVSFGNKEKSAFTIGIGRFEYKYNPQSRDLGEYLFRTGCYPAYIQTNFDLPLVRVNGILISHNLLNFLRQDLLLTTMTDVRPFLDFSLTYLADAFIGKVFDVGAGVQFDHLFSVDKKNETSPKDYFSNGYLNTPDDTGYYTFAGTKLMLRFMFDPLKLFNARFFGEKDGMIYAEAAVLGLKDYPKSNIFDPANKSNVYGYDNIFEKIPAMIGFNIPTCRILDVFSIEGEWFGAKYPNSNMDNYNAKPIPASLAPDADTADYRHDDWKWALYAKKTIFGGLSIIGLIGRDHLRTETFIRKNQDFEETLIKNNHMYWMLKIKSAF
jgi:hypothetical protein